MQRAEGSHLIFMNLCGWRGPLGSYFHIAMRKIRSFNFLSHFLEIGRIFRGLDPGCCVTQRDCGSPVIKERFLNPI